jgi:hypothetical protein
MGRPSIPTENRVFLTACIAVAVSSLDREYVIDCAAKPVLPKLLLNYVVETKSGEKYTQGDGFFMGENTTGAECVMVLEFLLGKDIKGAIQVLPGGNAVVLKSVNGHPLKRVEFSGIGWIPDVTIRLKAPAPPKK